MCVCVCVCVCVRVCYDILNYKSMYNSIQLKYGYEGYRQFPLPRAQVYFQRRSRGK